MNELLKYRKNALLDGLCKEWDKMWASCRDDKEKLMRLALMQQSFPHFATYCKNGKGLTKDYLLSEFKDYVNNHIFYDCDNVKGFSYEMFVAPQNGIELCVDVSYFLWAKDTVVTIPKTKAPKIYISNGSIVYLSLDGFNSPVISLYDNSEVIIDDADENSNIIVYRYSDDARVECGKYCLCEVKEFRKDLRLQL